MKKWIVSILLLIAVFSAAVYLLTPSSRSFSHAVRFHQAPQGVLRALSDPSTWKGWWPGEIISGYEFRYGNYNYRVIDKGISSLVLMVSNGSDSMRTTIDLVISDIDSIGVVWSGSEQSTANLFTRTSRLFRQDAISRETGKLLPLLQDFYSRDENLYGIKIMLANVVDTALVSTWEVRADYPSTADVYRLLDKLETYIDKNGAAKTGNPMLNISIDHDSTLVRVAIPVNRRLRDSGKISYKWMLPGGRICVADYKGGPFGAMRAVSTVELFLKDRELKQPVIPYQSLVTDRRTEPDTSKWITRIYCPYY